MRGRERCDEILRLIDETLGELGLAPDPRDTTTLAGASSSDPSARRLTRS